MSKDAPIGEEINGPGKRFMESVVLDNILEAFLELSAEVWAHRDRAIVLEAVLGEVLANTDANDLNALIEAHQPSEAQRRARASEREAFTQSVFRSFTRDLEATDEAQS